MRSVPRWAWALWLVAGLVLEVWALATRAPGDTLTDTLVATVPGVIVISFMTLGTPTLRGEVQEVNASVDPKQVRVRCPSCYYPIEVRKTVCRVCGELLDPREQWLAYERSETRTQ